MPAVQPFYINGPSLSSSTAVFDDAALTICSPDGFYSDGVVVREQINCELLPEQICTACCNDMCSGWNITTLIGTVTFEYDSCATQQTVTTTLTGPFDEDLCVMYGTTPVITFGKASLVHRQDCGCCTEDCNTYNVIGISGSATVEYIDCSGVTQTDTFTVSGSTFCCKTNTTPQIIGGSGFVGFVSCGCEA